MAKNDMIANHKRGLINSTLGNGFRGGLTGAAIFGGIAALATIATGGLALPLVIGAAAAGGALFGGMNAIGGGLRWGAEFVGGVIGVNRKQRPGNDMGYDGQQQSQQQGMGLVEGVVALVGAAMGMKSMKDKLGNTFGGKDREQGAPEAPSAPAYGGPKNGLPREPHMSALLQSRLDDEGKLSLTNQDLADPNIRRDLENFSRDAERHTKELHKVAKGGRNPAALERLEQLNEAAGTPINHDAAENRFTFDPASLRNKNLPNHLSSLGEETARTNEAELRARYEAARSQSQDLQRGNVNLDFGNQQPEVVVQTQKTAEAAPAQPEAPAQEKPALRPDTPATQAFAENMRKLAQEGAEKRGETPAVPVASAKPEAPKLEVVQHEKRGLNADARREALGAAGALLGSGAQHKGGTDVARVGSATGQQQTEERARS